MKYVLIYLLLFQSLISFANDSDSIYVLNFENYLQIVKENHPIIQQSNLLAPIAESEILRAKGAFDPKLEAEHEHKQFANKNYFRATEVGLKIPTWWGIDVKLAYNWSNGVFVNPENNLPQNGQAIIGVEVPLLNGLRFDKRREQVEQARLLQTVNKVEQQRIINDLILAATEVYWNWVYAYQELETFRNFRELAAIRFELSKESFSQGMKPAIDTLESFIQYQNRTLEVQQALQNFKNAGLELSVFMWNEDTEPLELENNTVPPVIENSSNTISELLANNWRTLINSHPELKLLELKGGQIQLKEKLAREDLKPNLNLSYNFLGNGLDFVNPYQNEGVGESVLTNNYKWGIQFSYPLFLRKARGKINNLQLKRQSLNFKIDFKRQSLINKVQVLIEQILLNRDQIIEQEKIIQNYERLLEAENIKFEIGESSVFLLNNREQKMIDARLKLYKNLVLVKKLNAKINNALNAN